jgi:hypothetical protein
VRPCRRACEWGSCEWDRDKVRGKKNEKKKKGRGKVKIIGKRKGK